MRHGPPRMAGTRRVKFKRSRQHTSELIHSGVARAHDAYKNTVDFTCGMKDVLADARRGHDKSKRLYQMGRVTFAALWERLENWQQIERNSIDRLVRLRRTGLDLNAAAATQVVP